MDIFIQNMINKGYTEMSKRFLVKMIGNIEVNISKSNNSVDSITGYENSKMVDNLPQEIISEVENDVNSSL